jgi:hypothetical protein
MLQVNRKVMDSVPRTRVSRLGKEGKIYLVGEVVDKPKHPNPAMFAPVTSLDIKSTNSSTILPILPSSIVIASSYTRFLFCDIKDHVSWSQSLVLILFETYFFDHDGRSAKNPIVPKKEIQLIQEWINDLVHLVTKFVCSHLSFHPLSIDHIIPLFCPPATVRSIA